MHSIRDEKNSPSLRGEVLGAGRGHLALELDPPRVLANKTTPVLASASVSVVTGLRDLSVVLSQRVHPALR